MKMKTKLKRKNIVRAFTITIIFILFGSMSVNVFAADDPKITAVNYEDIINPSDQISISFEIEWGNTYQRIKGDVYVYYEKNAPLNKDTYVYFTPQDRQATKITFTIDVTTVDGDSVKFQIWFEWGRWTAYVGEIESKTYTISVMEEGFKKDVYEFVHSNTGVIIGSICGLVALAMLIYIGRKRKR